MNAQGDRETSSPGNTVATSQTTATGLLGEDMDDDEPTVLVVDDELQETYWFDKAFGENGYTCLATAAQVDSVLRNGYRWKLAFVDFHLGEGVPSGLTVLQSLAEVGIPTLAYTRLGENGRLLYAAAAIAWTGARGVVDKEQIGKDRLHSVVEAVALGRDPTDPRLRARLPTREHLNAILRTEQDVRMWRAWSRFRGKEHAIHTYLDVTPYAVREFRERAHAAVADIYWAWEGDEPDDVTYRDHRGMLSEFVGRNRLFFNASDLEGAVRSRGETPPPERSDFRELTRNPDRRRRRRRTK